MTTVATLPSETRTSTWEIDPAHSHIGFEVSHMMFAKVRGSFEEFEATLTPAAGEGEDGLEPRVEASIDAASIDTGNAQRDEHLRSGDFFDVERFPKITFKSRSVRRRGDDELVVTGDLTIRDVTREIELAVTENGTGLDPWGNERAGFSATATLDRRDFDLTWNQALETGGILVGNDVKISLEVQAVRQSDESEVVDESA